MVWETTRGRYITKWHDFEHEEVAGRIVRRVVHAVDQSSQGGGHVTVVCLSRVHNLHCGVSRCKQAIARLSLLYNTQNMMSLLFDT